MMQQSQQQQQLSQQELEPSGETYITHTIPVLLAVFTEQFTAFTFTIALL